MSGPTLLTLAEAAAALRCSRRTLERRIAAGELPVFRDGRRVAVPADALRRYLAERTATAAPAAPARRRRSRRLGPGGRLWD